MFVSIIMSLNPALECVIFNIYAVGSCRFYQWQKAGVLIFSYVNRHGLRSIAFPQLCWPAVHSSEAMKSKHLHPTLDTHALIGT